MHASSQRDKDLVCSTKVLRPKPPHPTTRHPSPHPSRSTPKPLNSPTRHQTPKPSPSWGFRKSPLQSALFRYYIGLFCDYIGLSWLSQNPLPRAVTECLEPKHAAHGLALYFFLSLSLSLNSLAQRNVPIDTSKVELKIRPEHVAAMSLESAERRRRKKLKPRAEFFEKIDHASVCKNRSLRYSPE